MLVNPNITSDELSDEEILTEYYTPSKYAQRSLYGVMAKRATTNSRFKEILFEVIMSNKTRKEKEMGFIMHSWLPAIFILREGSDKLKIELKQVLKGWTHEEKKIFLSYIKSDQEYFCLLYDI
jgi:hypothetical protein